MKRTSSTEAVAARRTRFAFAIAFLIFSVATTYASSLDTIGVNLLRATTANLDGNGFRAAQVEAPVAPNAWQVNPGAAFVNLPVSRFSYFMNTVANIFPNGLGVESSHSDGVAQMFYGIPDGVSTNLSHIDNFEANYFLDQVFGLGVIPDRLVNQSFTTTSTNDQASADPAYDDFSAQYSTLFISGVGNGLLEGGAVLPPATGYNGIGVGAYGGASSLGPTRENGRAKPDITAPASATSFSTPQVTGAAALLLQAGMRGDGGSDTNSAADPRTLKALLLNGAVKPGDWSNPAPSPLDTRYGAGVLNVFNSYRQLAGGRRAFIASTSIPTGNPHPPTASTGNVSSLSGWNFTNLTSSVTNDLVHHYCFNLTNGVSFTGTMTLVWQRQFEQLGINNLDLYLYDMGTGSLVASSISAVDNVEHIFVAQLPPGRYDLEVLKKGGVTVSPGENYALAFEFFTMPLTITPGNSTVTLSWPIYPAGFLLESTSSLVPPAIWNTVNVAPVLSNNLNLVTINTSGSNQFFRLRRQP
jgi:hypothetical protein